MFRKNKTRQESADRAVVTVQTTSLSEKQRQKIEKNLASLDPDWEESYFQFSVPMDTETQLQLSQLVSMFPNGDVQLETTSGHIIMSGGSDYEQGIGLGSSPAPHTEPLDDAESSNKYRP